MAKTLEQLLTLSSIIANETKAGANTALRVGGLFSDIIYYLRDLDYAGKDDIPSLEGYATEQWVLGKNYATTTDLDARIDALVNGAPAAYDTLKEIADLLANNINSIDDILTALGTKVSKDDFNTAIANVNTAIDSLNTELGLKLDAATFNELFEKVQLEDGTWAIKAKLGLFSDGFISAKGSNLGGTSSEGGAVALYQLNDVLADGQQVSGAQHGAVFVYDATIGKWKGVAQSEIVPNLTGYAKESWVLSQGFLTEHQDLSAYAKKSDIPTIPTDDINKGVTAHGWGDHSKVGYLTGITSALVTGALGYTPYDAANFTKAAIKSTLGISDWALASSKPSYTTKEVTEDTNLYFTNARAVSALKSITDGLQSDIDTKLDASVFSELFEKVTLEGGVTAIRAKYGLFTDYFLSAKGANSSGGSSSGGGLITSLYRYADLGKTFADTNNDTFNAYTINKINTDLGSRISVLEGKATNVSFTQSLINGTQIGSISIDGVTKNIYAPTIPTSFAWSAITGKPTTLGGYGITDAAPSGISGGNGYIQVPYTNNQSAYIFYSGSIDWYLTNEGWNGSRKIIHSGNYTDYAYSKTTIDSKFSGLGTFAYKSSLAFADLTNKPTTISGYGITDALVAGGLYTGDWNTNKANGTYYTHSSSTNRPSVYGQMLVMRNGDTTGQLYVGYNANDNMYWRGWADVASTPFAWRKILDNNNYTDYTYSKSTIDTKLGGYLPLSGGMMTGPLSTVGAKYGYAGNYGLNMNNSDIVGANAIYFGDTSNSNQEGLHFMRSNGNYDTLRAMDGVLMFATNIAAAEQTTSYVYNTVYHTGNLTKSSIGLGNVDNTSDSNKNVNSSVRLRSMYGIDTSNNMSGRPTTANLTFTDKSLRFFLATNSMTEGKPPTDSCVLHLAWDNTAWGKQIAAGLSGMYYRCQNEDTSWNGWKQIAFTDSNVASATKLATSRKLWGQSFNGENDVNGHLSIGTILGQVAANRAELSIVSETDVPCDLWLGNSAGNVWSINCRPSNENRSFSIFHGSLGHLFRIDGASGNVGIGTTSPQYKLDVVGGGLFTDSTNTYGVIIGNNNVIDGYTKGTNSANLYINHYTAGNVYIATGGGNVGIGTTSPAQKLDVNGEILIHNFHALMSRKTDGTQINLIYCGNDDVIKIGGALPIKLQGNTTITGTLNMNAAAMGLGGAIDFQFSDEINRYGGNLYIQHRGDGSQTGTGSGATGNVVMCKNGGNVLIGTGTDNGCKLDVNGVINTNSRIYAPYIFMGKDLEGIYIADNGISWHNASNSWVKNIIDFTGGLLKLAQPTTINSTLDVNSTLHASGAVSFDSILSVGGTALINGNAAIGGNSDGNRLYVFGVIRSAAYNAIGNNNAAFVFDKLGSHYTGIGANGVADTIYFGACSVTGAWVTDYYQKWHFNGTIYGKVGIWSDGYVSAKGQNTSSDMRLKNVLNEVVLGVKDIANAPSMRFSWKNGGGVDVGSSAQYWQGLLPDAVKERDGMLEMQYANIALLSAIALAKNFETHEERIARLERENKELRTKIDMMERRIA